MKETKEISACSEAVTPQSEPGLGDDVPCEMCGGALDTGCECTECNHDNWQAVYGKPFPHGTAMEASAAPSAAAVEPATEPATEPAIRARGQEGKT